MRKISESDLQFCIKIAFVSKLPHRTSNSFLTTEEAVLVGQLLVLVGVGNEKRLVIAW